MKNILIVYAKSTAEILNRKSAIGSYIFSLASILKDSTCELYINGIKLEELAKTAVNSTVSGNSAPRGWRKFIPEFVKSWKRERTIIRQAQSVSEQILRTGISYHSILEFYTIGSTVGAQISEQQKCPLTLIYDNPVLEEYTFFHGKPFKKQALEQLEKVSLLRAKNIVTYSKPVADYLQKRYPAITAAFHHHQNIDFSRFEFLQEDIKPTDVINSCFIGSFLKWHNTEMLVRAFDRLTKEHPEKQMKLYMVGDGMMRQTCEQLAKELKNDHIHFTGFLDGKALTDLQKQMHIGIMPGSNWYGAPNKIFEYGAMRMAVIAPATPTISYVFNPNEIRFFELNNPTSFNEALQQIVLHAEERTQYAQTLYAKIESDFSLEKTKLFYQKLAHI